MMQSTENTDGEFEMNFDTCNRDAGLGLKRKLFVLAFLLVMISLYAMPVPVFAAGTTVIKVANKTEFEEAISQINSNSDTDYTVELTDNIQIGGAEIQAPCKVTILGNGYTLTLDQYGYIAIRKGAELTLGAEDGNILNISSVNKVSNDTPGMLYVQGTCNMYSGVTLAGREGNNYFGGGVTVSGGIFHMYGGTIENCGIRGGSVCYGGGVAVVYGGQFVMDDGTIKNCYAESDYIDDYDPSRCFTAMGGGVFVTGGSSFVMNGGTISKNTATNMGGGVALAASYEEVSAGFGNLKSSAEILGGKVEKNEAQNGAGVFASAYYYAYAEAISPYSPPVSPAEKQGLYIKNAEIIDNTADNTDGYGGGVLVTMLKSPATALIEDSSIKENKAATGAGIMSYGYWTTMNIKGCTITDNTAKKYGGGFAAKDNTSGGKSTITETVLCNNIADQAGSDVYLDKAPTALPSALDMDSLYLGKPEDVNKHKIDGWYVDQESSRYSGQTKEAREEYTGYADITGSGKVYLIAAVKPSLAKITFTNEDNSQIYEETWYPFGTAAEDIVTPDAEKTSDETYDYIFKEWSPAIEDVTQDAVYTAVFDKVFKEFKVQYEFNSASPGKELPAEVMSLLPEDTAGYSRNANIEAISPSKTVVEVKGGKWSFKGFDKESVTATMENADDTGSVKFVGYWEFSANNNKGSQNENKSPLNTKAKAPHTGDRGSIFLPLALLFIGGGMVIATTVVNKKKKYNR